MVDQNRFVLVGKVVKAHGIKGEVKIVPFSRDPEECGSYRIVILIDEDGKAEHQYPVVRARSKKNAAIVQLEGVGNRNDAEALAGCDVWVARDELPPLDDGEFFWHQIEGMHVVTEDGRELGEVTSLLATGGHDVMVITGKGKEYLVPAKDEFIVSINDRERILVIAPVPGLLEINS